MRLTIISSNRRRSKTRNAGSVRNTKSQVYSIEKRESRDFPRYRSMGKIWSIGPYEDNRIENKLPER